MKRKITIFSMLFYCAAYYSQGWLGSKPDTVIAVSKDRTFNKVKVAIGNEAPTEQLHTTQGVRFEGLTPSLDTSVVVWAPNGKLFVRGMSSFLWNSTSNNSWLLGGNSNVNATNNIIGILSTNSVPLDFKIYNAGLQRARYLNDGNYDFGINNSINNTGTLSKQSAVFGQGNSITYSDNSYSFGRGNYMNSGISCGQIGDSLSLLYSTGSFMAGSSSLLRSGNYNISLGYIANIVGDFGSNNSNIGSLNEISNSNFSHIQGNNSSILVSDSCFAFGNDLKINDYTNPVVKNVFLFGENIGSEVSNSMKFGFLENRTMTLTRKGIGIQMYPLSNTYTPTHNLEVEAGGPYTSTNLSNIMFNNLPIKPQTGTFDNVVINPTTYELFRTSSTSNAPTYWELLGNSNATNPGVGSGQNFLGTRTNHRLVFATNYIERMTLHKDFPYLGINNTTPQANVDIKNTQNDNLPGLKIVNESNGSIPSPTFGNYIECFKRNTSSPPSISPIFNVNENERVGIRSGTPNSSLHVNGSLSTSVLVRSVPGTITLNEFLHTVINTAAASTYNLPLASTCPGREYVIINHGTGAITLSPPVTIANGVVTTSIPTTVGSNVLQIISDGNVWRRKN